MAVAIRLARQGSKKKPFYRVVAADRRAPRDGRFIEQIGFYDPRRNVARLDSERYQLWIKQGAKATGTVMSLVKRVAKQGGGSEPVNL